MLSWRITGFGHENAGDFTPIEGFDKLISPRRFALDKAFVDTALAAGAKGRFGERVVELIGCGSEEDPVAGVVLEGGERLEADWVFGADGRASSVAGKLGVEKTNPLQGEVSYLLAFWKGIPNDGFATSDIRADEILSSWAAEDGHHLLTAWGDAEFTRGPKEVLLDRYLELLTRFPDSLDQEALENAEMTSPLIVAPETLMRGYFRETNGPGWALVGDSCHFKHPGTGQGIGDAVEQAIYVAEGVSGNDPELAGYGGWLEGRSGQQYPWSFAWGRFPTTDAIFKGWAGDDDAAQDLRDSFSRQVDPSAVLTQERLARWF
jgi:flavin-dependent dehydrogenase